MRQIEFYFDPISPFAYLGSIQIERIAARLGRSVEWKPVLIGVTILKVMGLKPLPETPLKGPYLKHDAVRLAEYFDVPFRYHGLTGINSLAALRAFVVLKERDAGLAKSLAQKIFSRLWVRGLDITAADDVAEEAKGLGIDVPALLRDIETEPRQGRAETTGRCRDPSRRFRRPLFRCRRRADLGRRSDVDGRALGHPPRLARGGITRAAAPERHCG